MTELDKFKRRLVRSVARLMQEKVPEDELFERLGTQTGTNCKVLWERMRALTVKKLRRLLAAGDQPESIAAVARLSRTDWLLYDLVLVHEEIDVIGKDVQGSGFSAEQRVMRDLFSLVQRYNLEGPRGQALVENWSAATKVYNSAGHSCSPMLLQRRWYQLKESTRQVFYDLWTNYRGNQRLWTAAQETVKPSRLQAAIAKRYPAVVTQPFLSWAGMVQEGGVALPQQFEARVRNFKAKKDTDTGPELELIEPQIETIDLGADSDQDSEESTQPSQPFNFEENTMSSLTDDTEYATAVDIKTEPPEVDGLSNVKILVATHVPMEQSPSHQATNPRITEEHLSKEIKIEACEEFSETVAEESVVSNSLSNEAAEGNTHIETEDTVDPETDQLLQQKAYEYFKTKIKPVPNQSRDTINENAAPKLIEVIEEDQDDSDIMDDIIKQKAEQYVQKGVNVEVSAATKDPEEAIVDQKDEDDDDIMDDIIKQKADEFVQKGDKIDDIIKQKVDAFLQKGVNAEAPAIRDDPENTTAVRKTVVMPEITTLIDDGIEFVDDGIEYIDDDDEDSTGERDSSSVNQAKDGVEIKKEMEEGDAAPKFDLKLMMTPVVFSIRLDSIAVPKGVNINCVRDKSTMNHLISKNKPVRKKSVSQSVSEIRKDEAINESECHDNDDLFYDENRMDEVDVNEKDRVKLSSYLLQKPKNLSFNPIQLCKNPDFNTRLKRLSVTFFSSMRNRMLFKMCKPLTIDVHKAFESKIIDSTLYLKCTDVTSQPSADAVAQSEVVPSAIVPSAMPMQSLIDNTLTDVLANTVNNRILRPNRDLVDNKIKDILPSESQYISQNHLPSVSTNSKTIQNLIDNIVEDISPSVPERSEPTDDPTWRNKVINLPDISRVREINQKLLTAEVPPIRKGNQVQPSTPLSQLKIESKPKSNISGFEESTSTNMINEFARESEKVEDVLGSKARPRPLLVTTPSRDPVPWNKARGNTSWKPGDFLLTADTLVKMLDKIEGSEGGSKTKTKKTAAVKNPSVAVKTPPEVSRNPKQAAKAQKKVAVKSTTHSRLGAYCCWVKYRADKLSMKLRVVKLHRCQFGKCMCCCAGKYPPPPGVWSHEEALKNACASIESVIQQSSPPMPVVRVQQGLSKQQANAMRSPIHNQDVPVNTNAMIAIQPGPDNVPQITTAPATGTPGKIGRGRPMSIENISSKPFTKVAANSINHGDLTLDARSAEDNDVSQDSSHTAADPSEEPILLEDPPSPPDFDPPSNMAVYSHTTKRNKPSTSTQTTPALDFKYCTECTDTDSTAPVPTLAEPPHVPVISSDNINITVNHGNIVIENNYPNFVNLAPKADPPSVVSVGKNKVVCFSLPKKASATPLHLGKNKILLTNVKFPSEIRPAAAELPPPVSPNPTVVPELSTPLPAGVHLVLLPNGELTCTVEPGVQLDCEQLAMLPSIVEAVKKQIHVTAPGLVQQVSAPTVASDEVINLSDDEKPSNEEQEATNATVNASMTAVCDDLNSVSLGNLKEINSSEQQNVTEIVAESNLVANVESSRNSNVEAEGSMHVENKCLEGNGSKSNSRNLLSDLMEMSGISAEDTTSAPQEIVPPIVDNLNSVIPVADQPISLTQESFSISEVGGLSKLSLLANKPRLGESMIDLSEYNTITSLAELKYACQQQGKFYKLDLVVGTMAPINVSIKKSANLKSSALVDLTIDDMASASQTLSPVLRSIRPTQGAVPVKLIKAIKPGLKRGRGRPPSLLRTNLNEAKIKHSEILLETLKKTRGRKQVLKPDIHINLEDSDAPMEEEHLDESDSASQNSRIDDSGDSSDDEPLAKKVKRIRGDNINAEAISESVEPAAVAGSMEHTNTNASAFVSTVSTAEDFINDDQDTANDMPGAEQDQTEHSEMDIDEPVAGFIDLNPQDDNSSQEEDCILGV